MGILVTLTNMMTHFFCKGGENAAGPSEVHHNVFFNGQTDVKETFTETNSPIKIPEVVTWKERIYMGKKKGQRRYRVHLC